MNFIRPVKSRTNYEFEGRCSDLLVDPLKHTAFVGQIGATSESFLYLITSTGIFRADMPEYTYATSGVRVEYFCDVTIIEGRAT
jgi:hypothetical protein